MSIEGELCGDERLHIAGARHRTLITAMYLAVSINRAHLSTTTTLRPSITPFSSDEAHHGRPQPRLQHDGLSFLFLPVLIHHHLRRQMDFYRPPQTRCSRRSDTFKMACPQLSHAQRPSPTLARTTVSPPCPPQTPLTRRNRNHRRLHSGYTPRSDPTPETHCCRSHRCVLSPRSQRSAAHKLHYGAALCAGC